jgi:diguanylate cyclase (GGDEF)-like protein
MPSRAPAAFTAAIPILLLPICWLPTTLVGGAMYAPPLLFFAPILLAALRGRLPLAIGVALAAVILAGPLTPQDIDAGIPQRTSDWVVRGGYFLAAAIGMTVAVRRLRRQALHDPLTGLPNRALLAEHLTVALARARRTGRALAVASIDLDDFKLVNDNLGHAAGDRLLGEVAGRIAGSLRETDVLARQGGDEFLVLLSDLDDGRTATVAANAAYDRIRAALDEPFRLGGAELQIGMSMGVSVFPDDAADAEALHRHADAAMYKAKNDGGGIACYEAGEAAAPLARLSLAARLRRAIDEGELELHYQPIYDMAAGGILGMEALVRWRHPRRGLVPPLEFIPVAEQTGVIDALGDWVVHETCRQAQAWRELGLLPGFGVNVSPYQLRRADFAERLAATVASYGMEPSRFIVELTESAWMLEADRTMPMMAQLREAGFVLALDDFGAGYSSLSRLIDLPLQVVKIDRQFLSGVPERPQAVAVLEAIMNLTRTCGCDVVLEGIETQAQRDVAVAMGCTIGQGFGLARPVPAGEATVLLLEGMLQGRRLPQGADASAQTG